MADDTLPPDAPDPETIAAAEEEPDPLLANPPRTRGASDPTDPVARREDATKRGPDAIEDPDMPASAMPPDARPSPG
jgi:hypothetical protein